MKGSVSEANANINSPLNGVDNTAFSSDSRKSVGMFVIRKVTSHSSVTESCMSAGQYAILKTTVKKVIYLVIVLSADCQQLFSGNGTPNYHRRTCFDAVPTA